MIFTSQPHSTIIGRFLACASLLLLGFSLTACNSEPKPKPREYLLYNPWPQVQTLAVAPAINLSASKDFDPLTISDHMQKQAQQVKGFSILPVDKTIEAMNRLGVRAIDSPQTAQNIIKILHVDGLLVPVITAYDPYSPPSIGMTLQFYGTDATRQAVLGNHNDSTTDPDEPQARQITGATLPPTKSDNKDSTPHKHNNELSTNAEPIAQVSAIFDANNQTVLAELKDFAKGRTDYDSAFQEERFLADVDAYTKFVCHAMVRRLLELQPGTPSGR